MDTLRAIQLIEEEDCTYREFVEAVAYLMRTGQIWSLQGMYGRLGMQMIETGVMDQYGNIDWNVVEQNEK